MDKARKAYHDEMTAVQKHEKHELQELELYKKHLEEYVTEDINRRYAKINNEVRIAKRQAVDKHNKVSEDIMRNFNRNHEQKENMRRESIHNPYIPHREEPRETPTRIYKFHESDENNIQDYYYKVLGVTRNASRQEIIKGFRAKSLLYHPDRASDHLNKRQQEDMFKVINRAYHLLSVPENEVWKQQYDKIGNSSGWVQVQTMKSSYASSEYNPYRVIQ